ncbi:hypothetical protein PG911_13690 [Tenacibaculum ovolyticum]|uniref:hypothetical protein n=1 Tax=Tenacibaculum ovolyticum TaxID=104270 RepID=UPI00048E67A4|nr:hypothetical protein [Tenacibaculum ovolyticum]WBX75701.1 hypothetical protein PG911_13690 [Tenacibaculum ovolyticum]
MKNDSLYTTVFGKRISIFLIIPLFLVTAFVMFFVLVELSNSFTFTAFLMLMPPVLIKAFVQELLGIFNVNRKIKDKLSLIICIIILSVFLLIFSSGLLKTTIIYIAYYLYCKFIFEVAVNDQA